MGHVRLLGVRDQGDELALLRAPFERAARNERLAVGEVELPLGRLAAVAVEAVLDQNRADLLLEEDEPLPHRLGVVGGDRRLDGAG